MRKTGLGILVTFGTQTLFRQFWRLHCREKDIHYRHCPADNRRFPRLKKVTQLRKTMNVAIPPLSPVLVTLSLVCRDFEDSSLWPLAEAKPGPGPSPMDTPVRARSHPRTSTSGLEKLRVSLGFTEPMIYIWPLANIFWQVYQRNVILNCLKGLKLISKTH